ncbi:MULTISPECIES: hypothetical protein [Bradyrhizobium]|uniref:hypothetical protein n=1 Tax=Bradyrhizobium TaxID=374 RepID=UPI00293E7E1F|nr:hypothetical protein [Bradyrhizobium sp. NDS-1]WOH73126.1 hypothetical protein RX330_33495 [Bradyrhizobium sp. NDS-1]
MTQNQRSDNFCKNFPENSAENFPELSERISTKADGGNDQNPSEIPLSVGSEPSQMVGADPYIVESTDPCFSHQTVSKHNFTGWISKHRIGNRKVTRSLSLSQYRDAERAWYHAATLHLPLNRFISVKPASAIIDGLNPGERVKLWQRYLNKLSEFASYHQFPLAYVWTRESKRNTGDDEHLHVLMHVPQHLTRRFNKVVRGWSEAANEIDVRASSYYSKRNSRGAPENVLTYITKNCPEASRNLGRTTKLGGPIFGKRAGMSANLTVKAIAKYEVRGRLRRELGLATVMQGEDITPPRGANSNGSLARAI